MFDIIIPSLHQDFRLFPEVLHLELPFLSKVMGIDASLTSSGIAIFTETDHKIISLTTEVTAGKNKIKLLGSERIKYILATIGQNLRQFKPAVVALEAYSFGSHTSAYDLAELGGPLRIMLREYCQHMGARLEIIAPTTLKSFMEAPKKELMIMKVFQKYGIECEDNNQADAIALAMLASLGPVELKTKPKKAKAPRPKK